MPEERAGIIVGVDTHTDTHAAVAIDLQGRRLDVLEIPATPAGYRRLLARARQLGEVTAVGVEGTGSYGAALSRFLTGSGITVIEVGRVNRQHRRRYARVRSRRRGGRRPRRAVRPVHRRPEVP
jgi:transposase